MKNVYKYNGNFYKLFEDNDGIRHLYRIKKTDKFPMFDETGTETSLVSPNDDFSNLPHVYDDHTYWTHLIKYDPKKVTHSRKLDMNGPRKVPGRVVEILNVFDLVGKDAFKVCHTEQPIEDEDI